MPEFARALLQPLSFTILLEGVLEEKNEAKNMADFGLCWSLAGYIVMLRARMFRSLIPVLMIKERNIRARNISNIRSHNDITALLMSSP